MNLNNWSFCGEKSEATGLARELSGQLASYRRVLSRCQTLRCRYFMTNGVFDEQIISDGIDAVDNDLVIGGRRTLRARRGHNHWCRVCGSY